jgi:hypothetical protein
MHVSMTTAAVIGIGSANPILAQSEFFNDLDWDSPSDSISVQEQVALLDPNCPDVVQKTKLTESYDTIIKSTGLESKKRKTVKALESNPPITKHKDPPSP